MQSPLTIHHEKLGATLDSHHVPLSYGNAIDEYWALKKAAGITDLSHQGRLIIEGKDRISFLNGLVTNDLAQVKGQTGLHSVLLNTKARVLADLHVYNLDPFLLVDAGTTSASGLKGLLDEFIITEDVQIRVATGELLQFTVQGPKSQTAVQQILGLDAEIAPLSLKQLGPSIIISRERGEAKGYDIILPRDEAEAVWQSFLLKGGDIGVRPVGLDALDIVRLEKGVPKYGVDVDENTIVLEAGFRDAISFTKGCYMGQEVVARATHIGRVNKHLVKLEAETNTAPVSRAKLFRDGKEAGYVTSAAFSPGREKVVGLGYVAKEFVEKGTGLAVEAGAGTVAVSVLGIA